MHLLSYSLKTRCSSSRVDSHSLKTGCSSSQVDSPEKVVAYFDRASVLEKVVAYFDGELSENGDCGGGTVLYINEKHSIKIQSGLGRVQTNMHNLYFSLPLKNIYILCRFKVIP